MDVVPMVPMAVVVAKRLELRTLIMRQCAESLPLVSPAALAPVVRKYVESHFSSCSPYGSFTDGFDYVGLARLVLSKADDGVGVAAAAASSCSRSQLLLSPP
jgi:hypothetical protein